MILYLILLIIIFSILFLLHWLSYSYLKNNIISTRKWSLNLCCGVTDGGGINADIKRHYEVPRFDKLSNIYELPYGNGEFEWVLCSHTAEHVENPEKLDRELRRVGQNIVYILPPLWDIGAAVNIFEHRWLFITIRKTHKTLPKYIKLPGADLIQSLFGQVIKA